MTGIPRNHLRETEEDLQVKRTAWRGNFRILMRWVNQYAAEDKPGGGESELQVAILADAKADGFGKGVVRDLGRLTRRMKGADEEQRKQLQIKFNRRAKVYAATLGLEKAFS